MYVDVTDLMYWQFKCMFTCILNRGDHKSDLCYVQYMSGTICICI